MEWLIHQALLFRIRRDTSMSDAMSIDRKSCPGHTEECHVTMRRLVVSGKSAQYYNCVNPPDVLSLVQVTLVLEDQFGEPSTVPYKDSVVTRHTSGSEMFDTGQPGELPLKNLQ